jgi:hypothetical protein
VDGNGEASEATPAALRPEEQIQRSLYDIVVKHLVVQRAGLKQAISLYENAAENLSLSRAQLTEVERILALHGWVDPEPEQLAQAARLREISKLQDEAMNATRETEGGKRGKGYAENVIRRLAAEVPTAGLGTQKVPG